MKSIAAKGVPAEKNDHPIIFTFRDVVTGDGFLAGITLSGKLLVRVEDAKWWTFGVRPGGIAESGETPQQALAAFRNRYRETLFDIANECRTYEAFQEEVSRFFFEPDPEEEHRWEDALMRAREEGAVLPPGLEEIPKGNPEVQPSGITIERLDLPNRRFMPSDNIRDAIYYPQIAA